MHREEPFEGLEYREKVVHHVRNTGESVLRNDAGDLQAQTARHWRQEGILCMYTVAATELRRCGVSWLHDALGPVDRAPTGWQPHHPMSGRTS